MSDSYDDEQLRGEAFMHATLLLLELMLRSELPGELSRTFALSSLQHQASGLDCLKLLINYVVQGTDRVDAEVLRGALRQDLP